MVCLDTACGVALTDKTWIINSLDKEAEVREMATPLRVKGAGNVICDTSVFVILKMYIADTKDGRPTLAEIQREVHLIDKLNVKMLIGNDVIGPEQIMVNVAANSAHVGTCSIDVAIDTGQCGQCIQRDIPSSQACLIEPYSTQFIPIKSLQLSQNKDLVFKPLIPHKAPTFYAHLVDSTVGSILVKNKTNRSVQLPKTMKLGTITDVN